MLAFVVDQVVPICFQVVIEGFQADIALSVALLLHSLEQEERIAKR